MNAFQKANYIFEGKDPDEICRIIASAIVMGELVFKHRNSLHPAHVREFLRIVLSKITEAEPKDKKRTRYCSLDAFRNPLPDNLQHEHVLTVKAIREDVLAGSLEQVEELLKTALACTVTKWEHTQKLGKVDKSVGGWDRYYAARIPVVDVKKTQESGGNIVFLISPESFTASSTT